MRLGRRVSRSSLAVADRLSFFSLGHEISRVKGIDRFDRFSAVVLKMIFNRADRQAGRIGITGNERTPAGNLNLQRNFFVAQPDGGKREAGFKFSLGEARQSKMALTCAHRGGLPTAVPRKHEFPRRDRPFQHAGERLTVLAFNGERGKDDWFVKNIGTVAQRPMGERARSIETKHAGAEAANGKGNPVKLAVTKGALF